MYDFDTFCKFLEQTRKELPRFAADWRWWAWVVSLCVIWSPVGLIVYTAATVLTKLCIFFVTEFPLSGS